MQNWRSYSLLKDVQFSNCIIVAKLVIKLKRWLLVANMIKHNCKWQIVTCNHKLDAYIIQDLYYCWFDIVAWLCLNVIEFVSCSYFQQSWLFGEKNHGKVCRWPKIDFHHGKMLFHAQDTIWLVQSKLTNSPIEITFA
jgi:hypothetical protein